jgi:hypothetical protein
MKGKNPTRVHLKIRKASAAAALIDPFRRRIVWSFLMCPRSVAEAAAETGIPLKQLHYHAQRLVRLGLLKIVDTRRRTGRPVKIYKAVAESYFVPHELAHELYSEGLARELRSSLANEAHRTGDGMVFELDSCGRPRAESVSGPRSIASEMWRVLRLSPETAASLRRELEDLLDRYVADTSSSARVFLVHGAVAPRLDDTLPANGRQAEVPQMAVKESLADKNWIAAFAGHQRG